MAGNSHGDPAKHVDNFGKTASNVKLSMVMVSPPTKTVLRKGCPVTDDGLED